MQNPESKSKVQIDAPKDTWMQLRQGVNGGGRVQNLSTEYRFLEYR